MPISTCLLSLKRLKSQSHHRRFDVCEAAQLLNWTASDSQVAACNDSSRQRSRDVWLGTIVESNVYWNIAEKLYLTLMTKNWFKLNRISHPYNVHCFLPCSTTTTLSAVFVFFIQPYQHYKGFNFNRSFKLDLYLRITVFKSSLSIIITWLLTGPFTY